MKLVFKIFFIFLSLDFSAQTSILESVAHTETMPEFKDGGPLGMMKFIQKNIHYPKECREKGIVGQVITRFVIDSTGGISDIVIRQSSGNNLIDKEAVRVISSMPKWNPGTQDGKAVSVFFNLPINFDIDQKLADHKKAQTELANKYYNDGVKHFQSKNLDEAKFCFKKALSLNCNDTDALYNLGATYLNQNNKDSACVVWNILAFSFNKKDASEADALIKKHCSK